MCVFLALEPQTQTTSPESEQLSEIQSEISTYSPDMRAVTIARNLDSKLLMCPPGKEIFEEAGLLTGDKKCEVPVDGLIVSLSSCFFTNTNHVSNYIQLLFTSRFNPNLFQLQLNPSSSIIDIQGKET